MWESRLTDVPGDGMYRITYVVELGFRIQVSDSGRGVVTSGIPWDSGFLVH